MAETKHMTLRRFATIGAVAALASSMIGMAAGNALAQSAPDPFGADDYYINYAAPQGNKSTDGKEVKGKDGVYRPKKNTGPYDQATAYDAKFLQGNPRAARQLAKLEKQAEKTGKNPRQIKQAKGQQVAELLTILVDFNPNANDDFTGVLVPETVFESRECVAGTIQNGPVHNNIPNPASYDHPDNNSMWVSDFNQTHYNNMLYTTTGITERVRTDLTGLDGQPGFDISGYTMRNMYEEMSKGAYTVHGSATPWVMVPHSEAWYAASTCSSGGVAGVPQSMNGHPDNPSGPGALGKAAVDALAEADPNFPWEDYDVEDQGDVDGDGNVLEPDGVVDHLVLVHAGEDKSGGGGAQGVYSIWAHSSAIPGGYTVPGTDVKISNYIVQPEDSGVGVFAHEYGHDLGLPDVYDITASGDPDVEFWDLMSTGSHSGPIFQSLPIHMGLWEKWQLGWADPLIINPGADERDVQLGQTSRTPKGTKDGIKINLPQKVVITSIPHSGTGQWFSGNDQSWADVRLQRSIDVPASGDTRFWLWDNYQIEEDWDYGFIEVSTDGGTTWSEQKVYDENDELVSTDDGDPDPNGRLNDYGAKKYGLTGSTGGEYRHDYVNLSGFAGSTIMLRLRYATDAGFEDKGWFADDFSVTTDGIETWSDDAETDGDWVKDDTTFTNTTGGGWHRDPGITTGNHYYLAEWRNFDGFDKGLQYTYDSTYLHDAWKVEKVKYNAPGMLVWYRDTTYGSVNAVGANSGDFPSYGSKGFLLLVDSHYEPLRRTGEAADLDPSTLNNIPSRPQTSNSAFTLHPTYGFRECYENLPAEPFSEYCTDFGPQPGVSKFDDSLGWYPGFELRGGELWERDFDASVVLPSVGNERYSTRFVLPDGTPLPQYYGLDFGGNLILGTGNPGDDGVSYGVSIEILRAAKDNSYATVHVVPANAP
jgi:immune inhibitor A